MDSVLKTILNYGIGVEGHFVNHQGRGVCISVLLDSGVHPEEVAKRTGHRDVKTMYENYYTQSKRRRKMQTVFMMGGIQDGKWDEEGVSAVMTREPLV